MICRLALSLIKAADPQVVRTWNIDHFSTQIEAQTRFNHGPNDVLLSPIRFGPPTVTVMSWARGVESEENRSVIPGFRRSEGGQSIDLMRTVIEKRAQLQECQIP